MRSSLAKRVARLERSPDSLDLVLNTALLHLNARASVDPTAEWLETWEATVTAMQLYSAIFSVTGATGLTEGTVQLRIAREMRTIPVTGPSTFASAGNWLTAFWLAVVCRDQKRLSELCDVPVQRLREVAGDGYDEYIYHWVAALQAYWRQGPDMVDELTETLRTSHPDNTRIVPLDLLQEILYPPIDLFYRYLTRDVPRFTQSLTEAVESHKAYWTDEERVHKPSGMVALPILAIVCLAHDGGLPIEVQSDYLPKHLIQRDWLGEFPT